MILYFRPAFSYATHLLTHSAVLMSKRLLEVQILKSGINCLKGQKLPTFENNLSL